MWICIRSRDLLVTPLIDSAKIFFNCRYHSFSLRRGYIMTYFDFFKNIANSILNATQALESEVQKGHLDASKQREVIIPLNVPRAYIEVLTHDLLAEGILLVRAYFENEAPMLQGEGVYQEQLATYHLFKEGHLPPHYGRTHFVQDENGLFWYGVFLDTLLRDRGISVKELA